jgi:hypothetical protein
LYSRGKSSLEEPFFTTHRFENQQSTYLLFRKMGMVVAPLHFDVSAVFSPLPPSAESVPRLRFVPAILEALVLSGSGAGLLLVIPCDHNRSIQCSS